MPIPVLCPGCDARLSAPDHAAGKTVKCPKCQTAMIIPRDESEDDAESNTETRSRKPAPLPSRESHRPSDDEGEDENDRRRRRKKADDDSSGRRRRKASKKAKGNTGLVVGGLVVAGVLLVAGVIGAVLVIGGGEKDSETAKGGPPAKAAPAAPVPPRNPSPQQPGETTPPIGEPGAKTPIVEDRTDADDIFARAAVFRPEGPLPQLPPLPPAEKRPLLILNPGGHTAFIKNVFLTPKSDRLITVSEDKTVRVWDMASGEPLSIFNLPAGQAEEGMLWGAALSPDGKRLAVGGFPLGKGRDGIPIYLLAVQTGRLEKVLTGARAEIYALDFSPDGLSLAVGCGDGSVLGFEVATGKTIFQAKHAGIVRQVKFHPSEPRLATVGSEKAIAVWDVANRDKPIIVIRQMPEEGPNGIAWASDGSTLAVGCTNGEVHLLGSRGRPIRVLPPALERKAPIQVVRLRFLPDDKELVYGGVAYGGWAGIIDVATGERRVQFREHSNTVMAVNCSADGRLAVSSGGERNETFVWRTVDGTVYRAFAGSGSPVWGIGWAKDGKSIAWGNTNRHGADRLSPIEHTLSLEHWHLGPPPRPADFDRHVHEDETYSIEILDFFRFTVKENGRPIYTFESKKGNRIYSVTLLPEKGIVVGASLSMVLLETKTGKQIRRFSGDTGLTIALAPSPDGRYFISGSTDQTIRVWSPDADEPVLSIFAVGREWIAWTPLGYYACSASGERLIAWQVSKGNRQLPALHPAVRFRPSLYQPVLIKYLIPAGNLQRALAMAQKFEGQPVVVATLNDVLPPDVTITAPAEGEVTIAGESLTVRAEATSDGKYPVLAMRLIVDGRPFQGEAGIKRFAPGQKAEAEWKVPLNPGVHSLAVLAESTVSKGLSQPLVANRTGTVTPPNLFVLAVGVSDYPGDLKLRYAASDAERLTKAFVEHGQGVFGKVEVKVLANQDATRQRILKELDWLASKMTPKDVGVFSFSGHGTRDRLGRFYLVPVDVSEADPEGTCLSGDEFKKRLENMPGRLIAILDACHSGAVAEEKRTRRAASADNLVRDLLTEDYGVVVMCASLGREYAIESTTTEAGFFTLGLVEGLGGRADLNRDGVVFIHELDLYTGMRVRNLSGGLQNPVTGRPPTIRPFAVAKP